MTEIKLNNGIKTIIFNWDNRHFSCPKVKGQIEYARKSRKFQLMFRGCKEVPFKDDVFEVGLKASPALYGGDVSKLGYTYTELSTNEKKFEEIAKTFIESPMHQHKKSHIRLSLSELISRYRNSSSQDRFLLSQLLVLGLQRQIYKPTVKEWKEYLFVISCTKREYVALKYALNYGHSESPPEKAYILEYGCPEEKKFFKPLSEVIELFKDLNLGHIFPDKDNEIFVLNVMLPHYLLGYSELQKKDCERNEYDITYYPNPYYEEKEATLDNPPYLTEYQKEVMRHTTELKQLAWFFHSGRDWDSLKYQGEEKNIRTPE